jgi:hypothetical protein
MGPVAVDSRVDLDDVLHLRLAEPPAAGARLLFRERTTRAEHLADPGDAIDLRGLGLTAGVWDLYLTGKRGAVRVATTDPGFSLGDLAEYGTRPRDLAIRAYRTDKGNASVAVRKVRPHAEVSAIHVGDGTIDIRGTIAYGEPLDGDVRLVVAARGQEAAEEFPAVLDGPRFEASVDIRRIAGRHEGDEDYWDCSLAGLRLGKHLDDVTRKKTKIRYPAQIIEKGGRNLRIWAYYTDGDDLSITVREVEDE